MKEAIKNGVRGIVEGGVKKYFQMRVFKYKIWKRNALVTQEFLLYDLLNTAKYTEFGRKYKFDEISDYDCYKKNVPIVKYENIQPMIQKMLNGERDVLWPGLVTFFSKSSGTTNDVSKYIPVSHDALYKNNYRAGKDVYTIFFSNNPNSNIFNNSGSMLGLGGSILKPDNNGIIIGDISAILMSQSPRWADEYREPSIEVALMEKWKDKIPAIINDVSNKNISHISGVPTWFVSLFDEVLESNNAKNISDLFPNIELFIHGAVSFEPYRNIFQKFFPRENMKYLEVYNASEGFFAIQDDPEKQGEMLLLTDHGIFYEFIKMLDYNNGELNTITLDKVEIGIDYALIISTNAGLWRYDIGDTIQFTSLAPYRIKISGRTKHFINIVGEELMVGNTDSALAAICHKHNCEIENYTAGPIFLSQKGKGGHEWVIEFKKEPESLDKFSKELDQELQDLNSDYKAKRQDDIVLQGLILHSVPKGTFMRWMESRGKLGGQNKVPRLSNKRDHLDPLLSVL